MIVKVTVETVKADPRADKKHPFADGAMKLVYINDEPAGSRKLVEVVTKVEKALGVNTSLRKGTYVAQVDIEDVEYDTYEESYFQEVRKRWEKY